MLSAYIHVCYLIIEGGLYILQGKAFKPAQYRASDRVRKKITNYAEIFRNIMRKKVLIVRKTRWIMRKIFGSLRSPKITYYHAVEIKLRESARRLILKKNSNGI